NVIGQVVNERAQQVAFFRQGLLHLAALGQLLLVTLVEMDNVFEGREQDVQELFAAGADLELAIEEADAAPAVRSGPRRLAVGRRRGADGADAGGGVRVLGNEAAGPRLEAAQDVDRVGLAGEHDDRQPAALGVGLDPPAQVEAAVARQEQVTENGVKASAAEA